MATGKKPDPKRRAQKHAHATFLQIKCGTKEPAYKAGDVHGVYGHRTNAHQPCLDSVTDGALECPYCRSGIDMVYRAYVPLWDADWSLRFVLIGESVFESVDLIPFRAQVMVSRAKNPISPLIVREQVSMLRAVPDRAPWDKKVNMLDICLTLWQNESLIRWYKENPPVADVVEVADPVKSNGKQFDPMHKAAARRYAAPPKVESASESFDAIRDKLKKKSQALPSTNGHAPPKG